MTQNEWNRYRNQKFYMYCGEFDEHFEFSNDLRLIIGIVILLLFLTFLRVFILKIMCLNAGRVLHNK